MNSIAKHNATKLVRFYRLIPGLRNPKRADDDGGGTIPARAHRACRPVCGASAYGWHVFAPMRFNLLWDGGSEVAWKHAAIENWLPVRIAQFPGFLPLFDRFAPLELRPFAPPFLLGFRDTGFVQLWTGLLVKTAPGYDLLIRSPVNTAHSKAYEVCECLLRSCQLKPLFVKIRLTRTQMPVEFDPDAPFAQIQPVIRLGIESTVNDFQVVSGLDKFRAADWAAFRATILRPEPKAEDVSRSRAAIRMKGLLKVSNKRARSAR